MTYVDDVLKGKATIDDLDDYIDVWHDSNPKDELHDYLGLLWPEYAMLVEEGEVIDYIIRARKSALSLLQYLRLQQEDDAARRLLELSRRYADEWQSLGEEVDVPS